MCGCFFFTKSETQTFSNAYFLWFYFFVLFPISIYYSYLIFCISANAYLSSFFSLSSCFLLFTIFLTNHHLAHSPFIITFDTRFSVSMVDRKSLSDHREGSDQTLIASPISEGSGASVLAVSAAAGAPITPIIIKESASSMSASGGRGCSSASNSFRAKGHCKSASVSSSQRTQSAVTGSGVDSSNVPGVGAGVARSGSKNSHLVGESGVTNSNTLNTLHSIRPRYTHMYMYTYFRTTCTQSPDQQTFKSNCPLSHHFPAYSTLTFSFFTFPLARFQFASIFSPLFSLLHFVFSPSFFLSFPSPFVDLFAFFACLSYLFILVTVIFFF